MSLKLMLELYFTYLKISFASFGGASMIPLLSSEMLGHGWMTETEVLDIVAIAEMTPGPLALNCASFVGTRIGGLGGSLIATLGVLTPSLTLGFLAAVSLERFKNSRFMNRAMTGVRPAAFGMIVATLILLGMENYILDGALYFKSVIIAAVACIMLFVGKLNIFFVILAGAVLGLVLI